MARAGAPSRPAEVEQYLKTLKHPRKEVLEALRRVILKADPSVGEEIKWNAPTFFYTGPMAPSNPKLYRRYLVISNLFRKDCIRLVFMNAAGVKDPTGLLEGDYADGRRLAHFHDLAEVKAKGRALAGIIKQQVAGLK